jgi:dTMP kinase
MQRLKKGILIAIEGIDGSGKSSLAKQLIVELQNKNYPALLTKEPGATILGQKLRSILQYREFPVSYMAEFLLFAADRAQHFQEIIIPNLNDGKVIISDRLADSSLAYQGYGRGLDKKMIKEINEWVMQEIKPNLTIYLKIPAALAAGRTAERHKRPTSFEKENIEFFQKLVTGFDEIYKEREDVIIIDGSKSLEEVIQYATTAVLSWISTQIK